MASRWGEVPEQAQADLLAWFNLVKPSAASRRRLASLYFAGRFHAWNCIECGERCYYGEPEDWSHFQGARQLDFTSYPGSASGLSRRVRMCDHCRCYDVTLDEELEPTGIGEPSIWSYCDDECPC